MADKIAVVTSKEGDWVRLSLNGETFHEGASIPRHEWLRLVKELRPDVVVEPTAEVDDEWFDRN